MAIPFSLDRDNVEFEIRMSRLQSGNDAQFVSFYKQALKGNFGSELQAKAVAVKAVVDKVSFHSDLREIFAECEVAFKARVANADLELMPIRQAFDIEGFKKILLPLEREKERLRITRAITLKNLQI